MIFFTNFVKAIDAITKKWYCVSTKDKENFVETGGIMDNMNPALLVANNILNDGFEKGYRISPMKLQKLLYFVYKKYLQNTGKPLFDEYFEVWQHGPVLPSVYYEFKGASRGYIDRYAYFGDSVIRLVSESHEDVYAALNYVLDKYWWYSATELSGMTHRDGTAWSQSLARSDLYLIDDEIKDEPWYA